MVKKWYDVDMNNSKNYGMYNKQMKADLKEHYTAILETPVEEPEEPEEPSETSIAEDFETGWFDSSNFISKFSDNFDAAWFDINNYIDAYEDEFEDNWFTINNFINISNENFEGEDWDE